MPLGTRLVLEESTTLKLDAGFISFIVMIFTAPVALLCQSTLDSAACKESWVMNSAMRALKKNEIFTLDPLENILVFKLKKPDHLYEATRLSLKRSIGFPFYSYE